ncbi:hypothetical protein Tco_0752727 [Tanacetum coccineum]|uniref:Uncharacterized protein n=1 Tax=Tanacetum coccineum TaxID=301880 RepID=A0ABQ4Z9E1_9ASTR
MTTLAEHIIKVGAENRPPMLEKSMYNSWASRIRLFIKDKKHGRMMLDSIDNGPLVYPTVEEDGQTRPKKYSKLAEAQQLQDDYDVQATNIILHRLPSDVYALVNHQEAAKDIWDKVKLLMKGTELSYQELLLEILSTDQWMHTIEMTMQQVQVNTKFLNALPLEWSKFVTDVKLAKNYHIWEVIQRGNGPVSVSTDTNDVIKVLPPKTAEEILARERERKARTTLLMALPEDHLAKFHKMTDAKEM